MPSTITSVGLLVATLIVATAAGWFSRRQAGGGSGGEISRPKLLWLSTTIWMWFLVAPLLWFESALHPQLRWMFGLFAANWLLRGIVELVMLFVTRNWHPFVGIGHDTFTLAGMIVVTAGWAPPLASLAGWERGAYAWWVLCGFSVLVETGYASAFYERVGGATRGEDGIWFAADTPRFARINRITTAFNIPITAGNLAFIVATLLAPLV